MKRIMCKSKIHRATITDANVAYEGSITIDKDLMELADLLPFEQVHVLDIDNAERFITYVIEGQRGSGEICVNGAAANLVNIGDKAIILAYAEYDESELKNFKPRLVFVDEKNKNK